MGDIENLSVKLTIDENLNFFTFSIRTPHRFFLHLFGDLFTPQECLCQPQVSNFNWNIIETTLATLVCSKSIFYHLIFFFTFSKTSGPYKKNLD